MNTLIKTKKSRAKSSRRAALVSALCDKMSLPDISRAEVRKLVNGTVNKWCRVKVERPDGELVTFLDMDLLIQTSIGFPGGDHIALEMHADRAWSRKYNLR